MSVRIHFTCVLSIKESTCVIYVQGSIFAVGETLQGDNINSQVLILCALSFLGRKLKVKIVDT
jgi:hypothetical protein